MINTCEHCGTEYRVPDNKRVVSESTRELPPPNQYIVFVLDEGEGVRDFLRECSSTGVWPYLHYCKKGVDMTAYLNESNQYELIS